MKVYVWYGMMFIVLINLLYIATLVYKVRDEEFEEKLLALNIDDVRKGGDTPDKA